MSQQRADLVQIRNRISHGISFCCRVARVTVAAMNPSRLLADFAAATTFLTRIPAPPPAGQPGLLADAAWAFPLVGAGIGATAGIAFLIAQLLRLGDWPAALLAVLAGLALTGALHEDGLADTADGFFGGHNREQRLAIMNDSRQGTFGVLADRKSTRLNSSHVEISYAVFCLKKKKKKNIDTTYYNITTII